jgi:hypothetical protein
MAGNYTLKCMRAIRNSIGKTTLDKPIWQRLKNLGISISVRGTKAGAKVQRPISTRISVRTVGGICGPHGSFNVNNLTQCPTFERIKVLCNVIHETTVKADPAVCINPDNLVKVSCSESKDAKDVLDTKKHIKLCYLNARSVCNKADDIADLITDQGADICAITETWLRPGKQDHITLGNIHPPGFKVAHVPRKSGKGGGVALVYRDTLSVDVQKRPQYTSFETIEALVSTGNDCVRLVNIYRPPSSSKHGQCSSVFLDEFSTYIDSMSTMSGRLLGTGDFNYHFDDALKTDASEFRKLMFSLNLNQHISEPTHINGHTLDLILTRSTDDIVSNVVVHPPALSDHSPISLSLPLHKPVAEKKTITYRKLKDIDIESFRSDISSSQLCTSPPDNLDELVDMYNDTLSKILDQHAPVQSKQVTIRHHAKWYNDEIASAKKVRRRAEKKWRKNKLQVHLDVYKEECHKVRRLCRAAKQEYYKSKIEECGTDQKKLFRVTEELMHAANEAVLPSHSSPQALAEQFVEFFDEKISKIRQGFSTEPELEECTEQHAILDKFTPVTEEEVKKIITSGNSKSCMLDPIPTTLLKASLDILCPIIAKIINLSMTSSTVPSKVKTAVVFPLIKKILLCREDFKNYRPVSNLPYVGKIMEKVVVKQMNTHMTVNNLHDTFQSAYKEGHSTETALLYVYDDLLDAVDSKKCVLLTLLDLSAAFDTINHAVLLHRFEHGMGITGAALEWLKSYFSGRHQFVHVEGASSSSRPLTTGMPQGSVIGPFGFPTYQTPLGKIFKDHGIAYHLYADDTQVYVVFDPPDGSVAVAKLERCIADVSTWMQSNFLKLNHSKTEYMVIGSKHNLQQVADTSVVNIAGCSIHATDSVKNIGATFDSHLTMVDHVNNICRSCYIHIRNIGKIRPFLTQSATEKMVHAFVSSRLDHHNSLLYGLPKHLTNKLQRIQNHAARIVTRINKYDHVQPTLKSLHWLPISSRIDFKILLLTFKCIHGTAPAYLSKLIQPYKPSRSLRSADQLLLTKGKPRTKTYGERAFKNCAPALWNALPMDIRVIPTLECFKSALKTHLFKISF